MLEFLPDNSLSPQPKAVAIERERLLQVVHADGDDGNSWLHEILVLAVYLGLIQGWVRAINHMMDFAPTPNDSRDSILSRILDRDERHAAFLAPPPDVS